MKNNQFRGSVGLGVALAAMVLVGLFCWWAIVRSDGVGSGREEPTTEMAQVAQETPLQLDASKARDIKSRLKRGGLPEIDLRRASPPNVPASREAGAATLRAKMPGVRVDFDPITGAPANITAVGRFLSGPADAVATGGGAKAAVERFVGASPELFGHPSSALAGAASRITREDETAHSGLKTVVWQQQLDGIPLFNTIFKANLTKKDEIVTISSHYLSDPEAAAGKPQAERAAEIKQPAVDVQKAVSLAAASLNVDVQPEQIVAKTEPEGTERKQRFNAPNLSDTYAHLTWMPLSADAMKLAWDVTTFSLSRNEMFRTVVDAESGEVLYRTSLTNDISNASYRVYADSATLQPFDSPAPFSPGHSTPSSVQPPEVARQLVTLQAENVTASPNGWIDDGGTQTLGNNVDAHTDIDANNVADLPRPTSATRVFDFAMNTALEPTTYRDASVTHLFYLNNWVHDKLYALGFTPSAGNFQTNNFGLGGLGNDAVQADAQDGSGTNNANFSTPADGSPGRMQMYIFPGPTPDRDGDFDDEIVIHEYCHGLSNRLVGGGVGMSASQSRGMGEGWSDFYGMCLLSQPGDDADAAYAAGGYATWQFFGLTQNYYYGIRRYPYSTDMSKNPLTFKDIDPTQASAHAGVPFSPISAPPNVSSDEVHNQGEVWCIALWEVRRNLVVKHGFAVGNQLMLQLATDAMKLCPVNPNMLQSRDAVVQADLVATGGANKAEIWAGFAKRGMGAGSTSPASSTTVGVVESFDVIDDLSVSPALAFTSTGTRLSGPFTPSSSTYTLTNTGAGPVNWTAAKTQPWLTLSATSGTIGVGANTTVTVSINTAVALPLAVGTYTDTVTFTNTGNSIAFPRAVTLTVNPLLSPVAYFPLDADPVWSRQGQWAYGTPTGAGTLRPDPTSGATGTKVFGINLAGNYSFTVGGFEYLTTGPINLSGLTDNHLRFSRWLNCDGQPWVFATVDVSNDGTTWTNLWSNSSTSEVTATAWSTVTYPLGSVADNQSTVYIRWGHRVALSNAFIRSGWNLDDIEVLTASTTPTLIANVQAISTPYGAPVPVTLTGTDTVNPGGPLTFAIVGSPLHGLLTGVEPNLIYTPNAGFYGVDNLSFTVSNGATTSAAGGVTITVAPGAPDIVVEESGSGLADGGTLSFGNVLAGANLTKRFAIKNNGAGPLTLSGVSIDGTHSSDFVLGTLTATRLDVGQTAFIDVSFRPVLINSKSAALHFTSDDPDESPFDLSLTGFGTTPGGPILLGRDINITPNGLSPAQPLTIGSQTFFLATTLDAGQELWRTDGTAAGTFMVRDIFTGAGSSTSSGLTNFGGTLFFSSFGSTGSQELWKSDGTTAGTVMVKDINTAGSSSPSNLTVIGSTLFFSANEATNGTELWKSDGTTAGTVLVTNIAAGATSSSPSNFRAVGSTLFFTANDAINGVELWKSDGTAAGTVMVKDIVAGIISSSPTNLTAVGSRLFFTVFDTVNGLELWTSDGTPAGTVMVEDINPGALNSSPTALVEFGGMLFFQATTANEGAELWKSDGTAAGTELVKDIAAGTTSSTPNTFLIVGSTLYFPAFDSVNGRELWKTDGTAAGTVLVRDLVTGTGSSSPTSLTQAGGSVFFQAGSDSSGTELWKTDGTTAGTVMVKDINPGSGSSLPASLANLGGTLIFSATDGLLGTELWKSDGTESGTVMILEGQTGSNSASPANLRNVNGTLYFSANDVTNGNELWKSDGTVAGTAMVANIASGSGSSSPTNFSNIGSTLYFSASDLSNGFELWKSDGTSLGTVMVSNINPTIGLSSSPANLTAVGSTLYFSATDTTANGAELWKSDGTAAGTVLVLNINPTASVSSSPSNLTNFNGTLFFTANDGTNGIELWKSDGTGAGTVLVKDINTGVGVNSSPSNLRVIGSTLYFTATTAANGIELWRSDGTTAGTVIVSDIIAGVGSSSPANLTVVGSTLFFSASNGAAVNGNELWKSDGTAVGTVMVKDILAGAGSSAPSALADIGGTLFFRATTSTEGTELWKSDGTGAGTVLVSNINPGIASSFPFSLTNMGGTAYMSAIHVSTGTELWKSDGSAVGTVLLADIMPGTANSSPTNLTPVGNLLFYTAAAPGLGASELFVIDTSTPEEIQVEQPVGNILASGAGNVSIGTAALGGSAVSKTFTIKNLGTQALTITSITGDGADIASFAFPALVGTSIPAAGSATFTVSLNPTSLGPKSAAIHIENTDGDENPFNIALIGDVIAAPEIVVEQPAGTTKLDGSSTVPFGDSVLGVGVTRTFTILNVGSSPLNVTSITVDGANSGDFVTPAFSGAVPNGSSVTFDVTFTPSATGARAAVLHVNCDDADEASYDIMLTGIGSAPVGLLKLARDINQTGASPNISSMVLFGGSAYFAANTSEFGIELWKTDGTVAGTVMVKDISVGTGSSSPSNFLVIGSTLYFRASGTNGINGFELWKSDGTSAGTVMVKDIFPGITNSDPASLTNFGGTLYFSATDSTANGTELWKSDGTSAGTVMVANINTTANTGSSPANLTVIGSTLFFSATDATNGNELWKSDGTAAGTVIVKDIHTTAGTGSTPANFVAIGPTLFFSATDATNGNELWKSDGTTAGTVLIEDIAAGTTASSPLGLVNFGGTLFFRAFTSASGTELWRSDGTAGGTLQVKDINPGNGSSIPTPLFVAGSLLYFGATDGVNGAELWRSDGTSVGTFMVADINPGSASSTPTNFALIGGTIYFSATNASGGSELWRTDGTSANTFRVLDINPGSGGSGPLALVDVGGSVVFVANDGPNGAEIWKSDGTSAGTSLLKDITPGSGNAAPAQFAVMNSKLFFQANDGGNGTELWKSDGTLSGTSMVKDIFTGVASGSPFALTVVGPTLYFGASDSANGQELWKSDGTTVGTVLVKDINTGTGGAGLANLVNVNGTLYLSAFDSSNGQELWKSDGTAAGTVLVSNINPGATSSSPSNLTDVNGTLFFAATDPTNGSELWKSDGTAAGTVLVKDINLGSSGSFPANLRVIGSTLFFTASTTANGVELWKSDGTAAGTVIVSDIFAGTSSSSPANLTVVGSTLFFSATTAAFGLEVLKSDGTAAGTVVVKDISAGTLSSAPSGLTNVNGTLYFSALDQASGSGLELWRSDGTAAGTVLVKDIHTTVGFGSGPAGLVNAYGSLYFRATTTANGSELWKSDGTNAGTVLASDVRTGALSSTPTSLTVVDSNLFFNAAGPDLGTELWVYDLGVPEIKLLGNAVPITDGDTTPSPTDSTDFGATAVGTPITRTFTIQNTGGSGTLNISSITVPVGFTVVAPIVSPTVVAGASTVLSVQCDAASASTFSGTVVINNNDPDETVFNFDITCLVNPAVPEIAVLGNSIPINDGDTTPSLSDHTQFPATPVGTPVTRTFTISNTGTGNLTLSSTTVSAGFTIVAPLPVSPIAPGNSTPLNVRCDAASLGLATGTVNVTSDDTDEGTFDFAISCNVTVAGGGPAPVSSPFGDVVTGSGAPNASGASDDGTKFGMLLRGGFLAQNGMLVFPGELEEGFGGVTALNFQGIWKHNGSSLVRILRSGDAAEGAGGALFDVLPQVPGINDGGQITVLAALRPGTGLPTVTINDDTGLWTEMGGGGVQLLLREGEDIPGLPVGTKVGRFGTGCFATAMISGTEGEAAFTLKMKGLSTDSAVLRASISGSTIGVGVLARENTAAGTTGQTFGNLNGEYTTAVRMDAQGNLVFGAVLKPSGKTSLWYQARGGALGQVFVAGDAAPNSAGATPVGSPTFRALDVPSMGDAGTIAFRGVLNLDGDNATNARNDGIWRGTAASGFTNILRRGDDNTLRPGLFSLAQLAANPNIKAGNIYSGWLTNNNRGAWLGWVDLAGNGINAYPADSYGIYTDLSGTMQLLIKAGDAAPDIAGATMSFVDHPIVGGEDQLAFIGMVSGGGAVAGVSDKGVWRTDAFGGTPRLVIRTGDTISTTLSGGPKTIVDVDLPGSNLSEHQWETPLMDFNGRLIVYVTFNDGTTSQVIVE